MTKVFEAKVFRSGNSVALRLPKALGINEGDRATIVQEANGDLMIRPPRRRGSSTSKFWGCAAGSGLEHVTDRSFAPRPSAVFDAEREGSPDKN